MSESAWKKIKIHQHSEIHAKNSKIQILKLNTKGMISYLLAQTRMKTLEK
jgi:hypothetical protein